MAVVITTLAAWLLFSLSGLLHLGPLLTSGQDIIPEETVCRVEKDGVDTIVHLVSRPQGMDTRPFKLNFLADGSLGYQLNGQCPPQTATECFSTDGAGCMCLQPVYSDGVADPYNPGKPCTDVFVEESIERSLARAGLGIYGSQRGYHGMPSIDGAMFNLAAILAPYRSQGNSVSSACLTKSLVYWYPKDYVKDVSVGLYDDGSLIFAKSVDQQPSRQVKYRLLAKALQVGHCFTYFETSVCERQGYYCGSSGVCEWDTISNRQASMSTVGASSHTCKCTTGDYFDGVSCREQDQCSSGTHGCDTTKTKCVVDPENGYRCEPLPSITCQGNLQCFCVNGYVYDNVLKDCVDVDECLSSSTHSCSNETTTCVNIPGSYRCDCNDYQHEKIDDHNCASIVYEYRLIDPTKAKCCSTSGSSSYGVILARARKLPSGVYSHVTMIACLQISAFRPDPTKTIHTSPYVVFDASKQGLQHSLEVEALQEFSKLAQDFENEKITDPSYTNKRIQLQTLIEHESGCFQLHTDPVDNVTATGEAVTTIKKPVFLITDTSSDMFSTPSSSCATLPTNTAWYTTNFTPKPTPNPPDKAVPQFCPHKNSAGRLVQSLFMLVAVMCLHRW